MNGPPALPRRSIEQPPEAHRAVRSRPQGECPMTSIAPTIDGLDQAPTPHPRLLAWVREVAELTTPDRVVWCDGSTAEWQRLTDELVAAGTLVRLNPEKKPNSFWARTDPTDVARVEERTFICSVDAADAGPTNNWVAPTEMKQTMTELYRGCM